MIVGMAIYLSTIPVGIVMHRREQARERAA
jgi:hypothetical protein